MAKNKQTHKIPLTKIKRLFRQILSRIFFLGSYAFFIVIVIIFIVFARGYRIDLKNKHLTSTGILSITSSPKPARVYINGELKGVTDINLNLPYGRYIVEIKKDGYTSLTKQISLKGEIVNSIDAILFPINPSLSPLTDLGISRAIPVDGTEKVVLITENNNLEKDGIYLFESGKKTLAIFPPLKPIILKKELPNDIKLQETEIYFSPDNREGLFTFMIGDVPFTYLLSLDSPNKDLFDITNSRATIISAWKKEKEKNLLKVFETYPKEIRKIASDSFRLIAFSPDETKILYQAKKDTSLPPIVTPPVIGANQTPDDRQLKSGRLYIYDKKEDKNYLLRIDVTSENKTLLDSNEELDDDDMRSLVFKRLRWYLDSQHLVIMENREIDIIAYDSSHRLTIYSGPFEKDFYSISPDWNILILTNLNPQNNPHADLYSIGIR